MKIYNFKETEIGKIPEDWDTTLAELFCIKVTDGTHDSPKKQDIGQYLITSRHLKDGRLDFDNAYFISEGDFIDINKRSKVDQWDIIFSMIGTIGEIYLEKNININYAIKNVGLFKTGSELTGRWLFYYLKSKEAQEYISRCSTGTTQEYMTLESLRKFPITFPKSKEEMHQIAKILSDLDAKIELNQQMNATLEKMAEALFKRWFVDFEFPNKEGKPYKSSGGKMIESELGEIPSEWIIGKLGARVNVMKGVSYRSNELKESDKALVTLKSMNRGGGLNKNGFKEFIGEYKKEQEIIDGDIVVAYTDLTQKAEVIGRPAIVRKISRYKSLIASLDLGIVRPKDEQTNNSFLYYLLGSEDFQNHVQGFTNGTTVLHLSSKAIPEYILAFPPKELVSKFGEITKPLLNRKKDNEAQTEVLIQIRDSLLPKLMSGEIRVN